MRCPACDVDAVEGAVYCHRCGQVLPVATGHAPLNARPAEARTSELADNFSQAVAARQAQAAETELWRGGYSAKAMFGSWIISGLISLALLAAGIFWASTGMHWLMVVVAMFLPWLYFAAVLSYRWMSVRYLLTSQRFMHEHGILRRIRDRIELLDIDDISSEQGLLERIFGVGTIRIVSTDRSHPGLVLPGIDNVLEVASVFDDARLAERRRRGLHVEQI